MAKNVNLDLSEYNSFGPWAYEINDAYPLPRLFAPYFKSGDDAILKIKIPREIERRDAKPGMDLYDFVVALYEDRIRILERQEDGVKEHLIPAKEFAGIRIYENMLKGGCTVFSVEGSVSFPFNAVSVSLFRKFTELAIEKLQDKGSAGAGKQLPVTESLPETMLLTNLLHDVQVKKPDVRIGAVQKGVDVYRVDTFQNRIERLLWKEMNPEALHLYTDRELIILENGSFPNRAGMPDFGYTYTIIPFNRINQVEITDSKDYYNLQECSLFLGTDRITYHFDPDNKEVEEFYSALKRS